MKAHFGSVVLFRYKAFDTATGECVEDLGRTYEEQIGARGENRPHPKVEEALLGHSAGDEFDVILTPSDRGGDYDPGLVVVLAKARFAGDGPLEVGEWVKLTTAEGSTVGKIIGIEGGKVRIDLNPAHAGKTLRIAVRVLEVRTPTQGSLFGLEPPRGLA